MSYLAKVYHCGSVTEMVLVEAPIIALVERLKRGDATAPEAVRRATHARGVPFDRIEVYENGGLIATIED